MAVETSQPLRNPEIVVLARSLLERRQEIADGMADRIQTEVDFYRSGAVSLDDLRASCDRNLEMILWPLVNPAPVDLRPPQETGRRRARQRAPLSEVMAAYRVGFRFVWETLVVEAQRAGPDVERGVGGGRLGTLGQPRRIHRCHGHRLPGNADRRSAP